MSSFPLGAGLLASKAILVPSGDQSGRPPRVVTSVGVPPAAGTTATRQSEVKAILVPSGDQFGEWSDAVPVTSAVWLVPLAFITQMSEFELPAVSYAIFVPSGDQLLANSFTAGVF